jgi:hypothetical protein
MSSAITSPAFPHKPTDITKPADSSVPSKKLGGTKRVAAEAFKLLIDLPTTRDTTAPMTPHSTLPPFGDGAPARTAAKKRKTKPSPDERTATVDAPPAAALPLTCTPATTSDHRGYRSLYDELKDHGASPPTRFTEIPFLHQEETSRIASMVINEAYYNILEALQDHEKHSTLTPHFAPIDRDLHQFISDPEYRNNLIFNLACDSYNQQATLYISLEEFRKIFDEISEGWK